jgi:formate/nitrite transporter FocA (FNT family)|tara:strand:- start:52 stop:453 length:402 start_codon:yes stop_codon:yes gene_type:complete
MEKIIDNIITVILGLVIGSLFFFVVQAKAEPPDMYAPQDYRVQEKSNVNTALDDVINLILKQGFAGAIIVCLGVWTFRTDKVNRAMQKENIDKFVAISTECSGHMASVSARLENIEREIEQTKAMDMMQMRKG